MTKATESSAVGDEQFHKMTRENPRGAGLTLERRSLMSP